MQGTIKLWTEKGYGFAKADDGTGDYFIHCRSIGNLERGDNPMVGDRCEFDVENDRDGRRQGVNVMMI
jgi:cold shock CspA family protein